MADVKKLVFAIMRFMEDQKVTGDLDEDSLESLEVGLQCLSNAYGLDMTDPSQIAKYQVQRNLLDIFNAQISLEPDSDFSTLSLHEPTEEEKLQAEEKKAKGNEFMKTEKYSDAVEYYTQAIKLDNKNPVYYCNRAAAYSKINKHDLTIEDCQRALSIDPCYSKAYGRMGIAYTAIDDHESALECYRKALDLDPGNQTHQNNLEISEQKLKERATQTGFNLGAAGMQGMPGLPGMDLAAMFNNPAMMNMARTFMQDPGLQQMMTNMMSGAQAGGNEGGLGLLQVGQQLAAQVQESHPDLVAQLREQMGRPNEDNPNDPGQGGNPPPPEPPAQ
ncbi:small glutamine-rich tetratricopeptide repeat-containing protein alpha-like [Pecten maximus]|uniref:small glutamine-rich tetratricopeptide repeat-containing protein alpha-like n=1 Tax=Pecten maximus TaxID=6579 RepID=UPI0014587B3A|nr:small glutamine-rich tetratricopeptide repeat-containing protein alpha-like [Pecten maximus]XP_033738166.1 small glutamine-rich tetratricopeptide repeat-containing protein alpha-like [Pecten maximus]XP_033738167.1 small glutamine-rich tetratricopeptide repeat-containing protein alpha-like [Pecten maximus]